MYNPPVMTVEDTPPDQAPPAKLGNYEIMGRLGAGGMGEVYRAHDPALRRDVAIKVLPVEVARDPERLARLQREAQLLATFQHPHLASVYGFEQADGSAFLVMELVEGQDLSEMVLGGALPVDEALDLVVQVAEGLAAAHERGIIHRDLKPANVRVTREGVAKVLDFGLAKADPDAPSGVSSPDITASPTMAAATMAGTILGTAAYMSPEQARGKGVDRRTDVWSFGCLLYELLTGQRPFTGETVTDVLAAVVKDEPAWDKLPADLDPRVSALLRRCLQKDVRQRQRDLGDAALQIREAASGALQALLAMESAGARAGDRPMSLAGWAVAAVMIVVAAVVWWQDAATDRAASDEMTWLTIPAPRHSERAALRFSPDGRALVYTGSSAANLPGVIRWLDQGEFVELEGTDGGENAAFSPSGASIALALGDRIVTVPSTGGTAVEACAPCEANFGIAWADNDELVFNGSWGRGLSLVPAKGGDAVPLTEVDTERGDVSHVYPQALRGHDAVLFSIWAVQSEDRLAAVVSLTDRSVKVVARGGNYYRQAGQHLFFERSGVLYAQRFDLQTLETEGDAFAIADNLARVNADGHAVYDVSENGVLAYQMGIDGEPKRALWVDREGNTSLAIPGSGLFTNPTLSADDRLLALAVPAENSGYRVHVHDLEGGTRTEITRVGDNLSPVFTPDSKTVMYISSQADGYVVATAAVDGSTEPTERLRTGDYGGPTDVSSDGRSLVFDLLVPGNDRDVYIHTEGDAAPRPVVSTTAFESGGTFSADGEWISYVSDASGRGEVYVVPTTGAASPRQVTEFGVDSSLWSPVGDEIFLRRNNEFWVLPIQTEPALRVGIAERLFDVQNVRASEDARAEFAVSADGQRILLLQFTEPDDRFRKIEIIQNLPELLRRRASGQ